MKIMYLSTRFSSQQNLFLLLITEFDLNISFLLFFTYLETIWNVLPPRNFYQQSLPSEYSHICFCGKFFPLILLRKYT